GGQPELRHLRRRQQPVILGRADVGRGEDQRRFSQPRQLARKKAVRGEGEDRGAGEVGVLDRRLGRRRAEREAVLRRAERLGEAPEFRPGLRQRRQGAHRRDVGERAAEEFLGGGGGRQRI